MQPYWRHVHNNNTLEMLSQALINYTNIRTECNNFDIELVNNLTSAGGDVYATLTSLAYRQVGNVLLNRNKIPESFLKSVLLI